MSFRKEKKYRLSQSDLKTLKSNLISQGMTTLHPPRKINSCYFDTDDFKLFSDSEEGVLPRKKIRVRWYDDKNSSSIETKISSIEGRFKTVKRFEELDMLRNRFNLKLIDDIYGILKPALIVSYQREYFSLENLRVTFDTQIAYQDLRTIARRTSRDFECVMEIKTPIGTPDDYIESIVKYPTARFSKYSRGLLISDSAL